MKQIVTHLLALFIMPLMFSAKEELVKYISNGWRKGRKIKFGE